MRRILLTATLVSLGAACTPVDYVEIEPPQVVLQRRGESVWLRAKPMSRNGVYHPRLAVSWSCDNAKAVSVDSMGHLGALGPGHAICSAKAGGQVGTVEVEVLTVESVKIDPAAVTMSEDDAAFHPHIAALDEHGHELHGRVMDMKSKDDSIANVDGEAIWPVAPGHTQVVVRADDRQSTVDVTVTKGKGGKRAR